MWRYRVAWIIFVIVALGLISVRVAALHQGYGSTQGSPTSRASPSLIGTSVCHSLSGLPDPICTPGVADPHVTQANIITTICVSGYTTKVRPPTAYTDPLKTEQIKAYGYSDTNLADYEEDHLIPLEIGGNPTDPKNLWPEPRNGAYPATKKDGVENSLHNKVCSGLTTLVAAQVAIAKNWESAGST
jgi:hypothetical protein